MSAPAPEADSEPGELVVELGRLGVLAQRLLAVHVPDRHGRCRGCTVGGTGLPGAVWPCALHFYAAIAAEAVGK